MRLTVPAAMVVMGCAASAPQVSYPVPAASYPAPAASACTPAGPSLQRRACERASDTISAWLVTSPSDVTAYSLEDMIAPMQAQIEVLDRLISLGDLLPPVASVPVPAAAELRVRYTSNRVFLAGVGKACSGVIESDIRSVLASERACDAARYREVDAHADEVLRQIDAAQAARRRQREVTRALTRPPVTVTPPTATPGGCASDFACGYGLRCLKNNYDATGVCTKVVGQLGEPAPAPPRLESTMPKLPAASDCRGNSDCPVGFECDFQSGACVN